VARIHWLGEVYAEVYSTRIDRFNAARYWGRAGRARRAAGEVAAAASFSRPISGERRG